MCAFNGQTKWKMQIFDPIANANKIPPIAVNSRANKDLKRNENLNLNFEPNASLT